MKISPKKISETKKLAENLLNEVVDASRAGALVIGLFGDLGAGKTTFMQFFGEALGIKEKILSPTFVIEKIYKLDHAKQGRAPVDFDHLIHIDAYRIEDSKEMLTLGWNEIVKNPRNIICVEWADKIADLLPAGHARLIFSHHDEESRVIELEK